jgi:hypothetical protein
MREEKASHNADGQLLKTYKLFKAFKTSGTVGTFGTTGTNKVSHEADFSE